MDEQRGIGALSANERRVIAAIRAGGPLSRAGIARAIGLSAPAASDIVGRLAARGLLRAEAKVRGHVGQPHTPLALDPAGACAIGVKIGRRGVEAVLLDFVGGVVAQRALEHAAPFPEPTLAAARDMIAALLDARPDVARRLVGLGVATPWDLHAWTEALELPPGALDGWRGLDLASALRRPEAPAPLVINDASAALAAQLVCGPPIGRSAALYLYLGTFIGGGLALDGALRLGDHGNAGALASMPTPATDAAGRPGQLLHAASLVTLERALRQAGLAAPAIIRATGTTAAAEPLFADWLDRAAPALAHAIVAAHAICDLSHVFIDGIIGPVWRDRIVAAVATALDRATMTGLSRPAIRAGDLGWSARVMGAGLLPLRRAFDPPAD